MLICTAINVTGNGKLVRKNGTSKYDVWVGINHHKLYAGTINDHCRAQGAAVLLRKIADEMDKAELAAEKFPLMSRMISDCCLIDSGVEIKSGLDKPENVKASKRRQKERAGA